MHAAQYNFPQVDLANNKTNNKNKKIKSRPNNISNNPQVKVTTKRSVHSFKEILQDFKLREPKFNLKSSGKFCWKTDFTSKDPNIDNDDSNGCEQKYKLSSDLTFKLSDDSDISIGGEFSKSDLNIETFKFPFKLMSLLIKLDVTYLGLNCDVREIICKTIPVVRIPMDTAIFSLALHVKHFKQFSSLLLFSNISKYKPKKVTETAFNIKEDDMSSEDYSVFRVLLIGQPKMQQIPFEQTFNVMLVCDVAHTMKYHNLFILTEYTFKELLTGGLSIDLNMQSLKKITKNTSICLIGKVNFDQFKVPFLSYINLGINVFKTWDFMSHLINAIRDSKKWTKVKSFVSILDTVDISFKITNAFKIAIEYYSDLDAFSISIKPDFVEICKLGIDIWNKRVITRNLSSVYYDNKILTLKKNNQIDVQPIQQQPISAS